jgi:IS5 family transposase
MSWKNTQQNSFADSLVIEHKSLSELDDVHNIINWGEIEQTLSNLYTSKTPASAYPPIMMFTNWACCVFLVSIFGLGIKNFP